jgi:hypothetical protein
MLALFRKTLGVDYVTAVLIFHLKGILAQRLKTGTKIYFYHHNVKRPDL